MRECHVIIRPTGLRDVGLWKGLAAICMVLSRRVVDGVESVEFRYYIGSFAGTADEYLGAIRGHWGIENSLHWVLDVVFREDDSRHHAGNSGENLGLLRTAGDQPVEAGEDIQRQPQDQATPLWLGR